ncbi:MAG: DUF488 domain-containing protein [Planctomycetota bacterium]
MKAELYTIGHSTHSIEEFIGLLRRHEVGAVCDVRSQPYSQHTPQFNREVIENQLARHGIAYIFLGDQLGARSDDPGCYVQGKLLFDRLAKTDIFQRGIARLREQMAACRAALMCAEKDPLACHRMILICRYLRSDNVEIRHILENGEIEKHRDTEKRLLRLLKIPEENLFESLDDLIQRAYDRQGQKMAASEDADRALEP